ncbi:VWA domain-containing protein [Aeromicrobium sp.]|uniref:vWA domain-containing protein n=1 Tax=Aeromicrobium sp. TaxID=1871063 RepID=UPI0028A926EA|nr:VWA domain-containing protein [Aeromicrobium sp.]
MDTVTEAVQDEVMGRLVGFSQALHRAGVTSARTEDFVAALDALDPMRRADVYWAGRATLCSSPDDLEIYERVFADWFSGVNVEAVRATDLVTTRAGGGDGEDATGPDDTDDVAMLASATEVLRQRDVATLTAHEARLLATMFAHLRVRLPRRPSRRRERHHRGEVDVAATVREQLRHAGEPGVLRFRRRRLKPRPVVVLVDVSRSMTPYADHLLRLAHRFSTDPAHRVEVFTMGTRLTRVTRALRIRDPEAALARTSKMIPDWSGGTRLGDVLEAFVDRWGRRGMARGAVVVIASDGWERGDPTLLAEQAQVLQRMSHALIWVNPHRGKEGFEPVQSGMAAVLPHVDHVVAGHTFATFEELMEVVADV